MKIASYINDIKLKQRLRRVTVISLCCLMVLLMFAFATFKIVAYIFNASQETNLQSTISEYASNLRRKVNSDIQALHSVALFTQNAEDIMDTFNKDSIDLSHYPFDVIGYWNLDGTCKQVSISGVKTDSNYTNLPPQVKVAVSSAWLGRSTVSSPYFSPTIGKDMVTYVTPVVSKETNQIIGALSGAVSQASFDRVLESLSADNLGIDTFILNSSGFIFSQGNNTMVGHNIGNIGNFQVSKDVMDKVKLGLVSTSSTSIDFSQNGQTYRFTITPLGFSDWYLGTLNNLDYTSSPYFKNLLYLIGIMLSVFAVCSFIAIYLFISMKSSFKTQLLIAHYDPITEGYNYPKFLIEFDQLDYRQCEEPKYALATLNIHDFSYTVELLGEQQIEDVLKTIANIISEHPNVVLSCHREAAQFLFILNLNNQEKIDKAIRNIMDMCEAAISANISTIPIVMFSGVVYTYQSLPPDKIVSRAEFASKQIVKTYTHAVRFYDENSYKKEAFLHAIEKNMREALANEEFKLFLQPKIDLKTGKIAAAEALVRWISDVDSVIYPSDFIPLFENNGFCTELDLYMFEKVCQKLRYYLDNGIEPIFFSINQTKLLIFQKGYTDKLKHLLEKYNVPPKYIVIEVLEDLATHNVNELNLHIRELKDLGLSIALDDFGSGYSSLNIVAGLDIDEIKFDREFLMVEDEFKLNKNKMILKVLSQLAKNFGIRTVVEGVERCSDVEFLKTIDCDLAQGYYYDRPIADKIFDAKYIFTDSVPPEQQSQVPEPSQNAKLKEAKLAESKPAMTKKEKEQEQEDKAAIKSYISSQQKKYDQPLDPTRSNS